MSFIGNRPDSFGYSTTSYDHFNGDSSNTTFTLSRAVSSNSDIQVVVNNVIQDPGVAYYVQNLNSLVFTSAPSTGANNIYVIYRNFVNTGFGLPANSVGSDIIASRSIFTRHLGEISTINSGTSSLTLQSNNVVVSGNLTVEGATTTINAETLTIEDKNIVLANVASPSNVTADGGGITLLGSTNKTLNWTSANNAWESSENLNLVSDKSYNIGNVSVLSSTGLGSGVLSSSLTSVGTITSGTWSGSFGAVSGANLTGLTAGNLSGTIPSAVLGNSTHYIGTTAIALNRASASQSLTGITSIDGSAATLTTTRTLWGQNFNGSANVTGALTSVGNITGSGAMVISAAASSTLSLNGGAGSNGLVLDANNNVGIGTSSPDTTLYISSSGGSQKRALHIASGNGAGSAGGIYIESITTAGGNGATFEAIGKRSDGNGGAIFSGITALGHLRTDAVISGAGHVLGSVWFGGNPTGTTTADVRYSASIAAFSDTAWSSSSSMGTAIAFYTGATGVDINAGLVNPGTERLRIDSSGNLGIGVTNPSVPVDVAANSNSLAIRLRGRTSDTLSAISFDNNAGNAGSNANFIQSGTSSPYIAFGVVNTERARIDSSGNLGIGTSSPGSTLDIRSTNATGQLTLYKNSGGADNYTRLNLYNSSGSYFQFAANPSATDASSVLNIYTSGAGGNIASFLGNGNVGIGTSSPLKKLDVYGSILFRGAGTDYGMYTCLYMNDSVSPYTSNFAGYELSLNTGANNARTSRLYINNSGNIGIGTTAPATKTHVYSTSNALDADGLIKIEASTAANSVNASYTTKNWSGTSQFMQWENYGLRVGCRILTNYGQGNIYFTTGNDAVRATLYDTGGHFSVSGNLHTYRNRLAFSSVVTDPNHSIYNNYNNLDGEGSFDGIKMNVYAGLSVRVGNANGATPSTALYVDGSGRVTMPNQPAFDAVPPANYALTGGDQNIAGTWSEVTDRNNNFNPANGTFTAPVAGFYHFTWLPFVTSASTRNDAFISVNNAIRARSEISGYTAGTTNRSSMVSISTYLSANDYVTVGVYIAGTGNTYFAQVPWGRFSGFLVG